MAIYNEILVGRFARFLQKLMSMKGEVPTKQLSGEIMPVLPLFAGAENRFLESWDRFGRATTQVAVAAQLSRIQYRNPQNSAVVVVFEKLTITSSAADNPSINLGTTVVDLATSDSANIQQLDPRGKSGSVVLITTQAAAGGGVGRAFYQVQYPASTSYDLIQDVNQEIALLPGQALQVNDNAANVTLTVSALWRERILEESERQ